MLKIETLKIMMSKKNCFEDLINLNPKNYFNNFLKRLEMLLEIKGSRFESWCLDGIRRRKKNKKRKKWKMRRKKKSII